MDILIRIFVTAVALLLVAYLIPGIEVSSFYTALIVSLVLGLLSVFVKPILVILTLPITLLTFGLFIFVINALLFMFTASFVEGFAVDGFVTALIGSLIVSVISSIGNKLLT